MKQRLLSLARYGWLIIALAYGAIAGAATPAPTSATIATQALADRHEQAVALVQKALHQLKTMTEDSDTVVLPVPQFMLDQLLDESDQSLSQEIGWVPCDRIGDICRGYYQTPVLDEDGVKESPLQQSATNITAKQTQFYQHGTSLLVGDVVSKQPGRLLQAEKAYLYRDPQTGRIVMIDFYGHVRSYDKDGLITGTFARLNLNSDTGQVNNATYRLATQVTNERSLSPKTVKGYEQRFALNAWGRAIHIEQLKKGVLKLLHATYTTCTPTNYSWHIKANDLLLDQNAGWGRAWNSWLYVRGMPVFYLPYMNFPIDSRRKSGFLYPSYGMANIDGMTFSAPFYWNMAPNYDMTITPVLFAQRGVQLNDHFRFLTPKSNGEIYATLLPNDQTFKHFRNQATADAYPGRPSDLKRLQQDDADRWMLIFRDQTILNPHYSYKLDLAHVSDDYYFEDFDKAPGLISRDQISQSGLFDSDYEHWHTEINLQNYTTLHPVNQAPLGSPYNVLPQVTFNSVNTPESGQWDPEITGQFTEFTHHNVPGQTIGVPIGERSILEPSLALPFMSSYGFLTPLVKLNLAKYYVHDQLTGYQTDPSRAIPMFELKGGLFFDRNTSYFSKSYTQTLEPQFFYVYIPAHPQRDLPLYDTSRQAISIASILSDNQFSGYDRINDANRVTLAVTSRMLDKLTGIEKLNLQVGQIYYLADRQVNLCNTAGCIDTGALSNRSHTSPAFITGAYKFSMAWQLEAHAAWYHSPTPITQGLNFNYHGDDRHIFNIVYDFSEPNTVYTVGGIDINRDDQTQGNAPKQFTTSLLWPLPRSERLAFLGYANYDVDRHHGLGTFWGLEYNSCCWAVRALTSREFNYDDYPSQRHMYTNTFYLQFILKGLGSFGLHNPSAMFSQINGYRDPYQRPFSSFQQ